VDTDVQAFVFVVERRSDIEYRMTFWWMLNWWMKMALKSRRRCARYQANGFRPET
jgi:hypothetical protein